MKLKINLTKVVTLVACTLTIGLYSGCRPDDSDVDNGLTSPDLAAAFTITPVTGKINTYVLKAEENGVVAIKWDKGTGSVSIGKAIDTAYFPDAGTYTVTLVAVGKGGVEKSASKEITVATSDPIAGNLLLGAKMQDGDAQYWTPITYSAGVSFAISNGKMVATGGNGGHAGVYQAIQVEEGKKYKVDMTISGSGATDTWFEVYVGKAVPVQGSDYNDGGTRIALNTWAGCGQTAFNGKLSAITCSGSGNIITFPTSGTAYLVIRSGGANLGITGIAFTDVEFRGTN